MQWIKGENGIAINPRYIAAIGVNPYDNFPEMEIIALVNGEWFTLELKEPYNNVQEALQKVSRQVERVLMGVEDQPNTCETCKHRKLIDGKYRCSKPVGPIYACEHWIGESEIHMCFNCKYGYFDNRNCYCNAPLPEGHKCKNWEVKENV